MIEIDIQQEYINALFDFQEKTIKKLVKDGLELKGFKFESDNEMFNFIKKYCVILKDCDYDMFFSCNHKSFTGSFLFVKDPNKFEIENVMNSGFNNMEIKYCFL